VDLLVIFERQNGQVLELARVLCELATLAGLGDQASVLRQVQTELAELSKTEGVSYSGSNSTTGDAAAGCIGRVDASSMIKESIALPKPVAEKVNRSMPSAQTHISVTELAEAVHKVRAVQDETKADIDRLHIELQTYVGQAENIHGEARQARKEAHSARAEVSEIRGAAESQDVRLRVLATETQQLRTHIADTLQRREEDFEACRTRAASDVTDLRRTIGDLSAEARTLRQSITSLEQAERQRQADSPDREAFVAAVKQVERTVAQQVAEAKGSAEMLKNQIETWKQGFIESNQQSRTQIQVDIGRLQERLENLSTAPSEKMRRMVSEKVSEKISEKMYQVSSNAAPCENFDVESSSTLGLQDMPRAWRAALEDAVRRVQWISEELHHENSNRSEEHHLLLKQQLASLEAAQANKIQQVRETSDEALRRADEAMSIARCSQDLAHESGEASSRKLSAVVANTAAELRAETKAVTGDLHAQFQGSLQSQGLLLKSLDKACSSLGRDVAGLIDVGNHSEEGMKRLNNQLREVSEVAQKSSLAIEDHKAKFKGFLDPFRDEVDRRFVEVWQEASTLRLLLGQQERKFSDEVASAKAVWQTRSGELSRTMQEFSMRLDRGLVEWADFSTKVESLKRRISEEALAAVDSRCEELGDFGVRLRDTMLAEVKQSLNDSGGGKDLARKVQELGAALEFSQSESTALAEQLKLAIAAADRLASAAQEDASDAVRRSKHAETLVMAVMHPTRTDLGTSDPHEGSAKRTGSPPRRDSANPLEKAMQAPSMGGSGVGAARQLRTCTPRRPASADPSRRLM
jgi:chromosome segregation ATPase